MKEIRIETTVKVRDLEELEEKQKELREAALLIAKTAYAPYSRFHVGAAALLANGKIVTGNNQENAAYPSGLCAERVALFYAGAQYPDIPVIALAICAFTQNKQVEHITPCGSCRQVLLETETRSNHPIQILLCGSQQVFILESAKALLPLSFDGSDLPE